MPARNSRKEICRKHFNQPLSAISNYLKGSRRVLDNVTDERSGMLRDALETLAGPAFYLVQDPVHRLVTFERCMGRQTAVQDIESYTELEVVQHGD